MSISPWLATRDKGLTIKEFVPGSPLFLLVALLVGVVLMHRRRLAWWGRLWVTVLALTYWAMSTPAVAHLAAMAMRGAFRPIASARDADGARAIVVLEAGADHYHTGNAEWDSPSDQSTLRALEAARVYRLLDRPLVIATGGITGSWPSAKSGSELIRDALVGLGVPADRIIVERQALTTHQHAVYVPEILKAHGVDRFVLVTSPTHIRRSMRVFKASGLVAVASPAADLRDPEPGDSALRRLVPSREAMRVSEAVVYDLMAIAYYWTRGWI